MFDIIYFLFVLALGAEMGYIGLVGKAAVMTNRAVAAAMQQGAAFCSICASASYIYPEYSIPITAASAFIGLCNWHLVIPVFNMIAKAYIRLLGQDPK